MELKTCEHCEIKIESNRLACPVCGYSSMLKRKFIQSKLESNLDKIGFKNILLNSILLIVLIPIGISLVFDYLQDAQYSWSLKVTLSIFTGWLYLFLILKLWQHLLFLGISIAILTTAYLYSLNYFNNTAWFRPLGLPLSLGLPFLSLCFFYLIKHSKKNLFKTIAWIFLSSAIICIYIDILNSIYMQYQFWISWSLIVSGILIPLALLLFFLSNHRSLMEKWFHY